MVSRLCDRTKFFWLCTKSSDLYAQTKNPAYLRHQISRPMRIDALIQKEIYRDFFLCQGIWFGGGRRAAPHSTAEQWSTLYPSNYTALLSHAVHFTAKLKQIYIYSFNAQEFNSLDCIELCCIANCWFAVHCNVLDCTAPSTMHYTELYWVKFLNLL